MDAGRNSPPAPSRVAMTSRSVVMACLLALVGLAVTVRTLASLVPTPLGLTVSHQGPGRGVVTGVEPGGSAWLLGIRPGASYERIADGGGATVTTDGVAVDVPDAWAQLAITETVIAIALLVASLIVWRTLPLLSRGLLVLASTMAIAGLIGRVTGPVAVLLVVAPVAAAGSVVLVRHRPHGLVPAIALFALGGVAVACGILLALPDPQAARAFGIATTVPLVIAALFAADVTAREVLHGRARSGSTSVLAPLLATSLPVRGLMRTSAETERDRMAQRIHDRVMPRVVTGLRLLEQRDVEGSSIALEHLATDLRELITTDQLVVLREGGLSAALTDMAASAGDGPLVKSRIDPGVVAPWEVSVAALRIAQEAMRNASFHASADRIDVNLIRSGRGFLLEVIDDGIGIDASDLARPGHLGVASMRERAAEVGGSVEVCPGEPHGTRVNFRWRP